MNAKNNIYFKKNTINSINSILSLSKCLGVSEDLILHCFHLPKNDRYTEPKHIAPKKNGQIRKIYNPCQKIREIQKEIKNKILRSNHIITWPDYVYGVAKKERGKKPKDFVASAAAHCESKTLLKIDIKDFFDNISEELVYNVFSNLFKYPKEISTILSDICCHNSHLPQGAVTSSHLATLIFFDLEPDLVRKLNYKGLVYSRYIDDITISSKIQNYNMRYAHAIVNDMLIEKGLLINEDKTFSGSHSLQAMDVHGLLIDTKKPRITSEKKRNLRAAIHQLSKEAAIPNRITNPGYKKSHEKITGRITLMKRLQHPKAHQYKEMLKQIQYKPSNFDKIITEKHIKILKDQNKKSDMIWYNSFYHKVEYRVRWFYGQNNEFRKTAYETLSLELKKYMPKKPKQVDC